jgi:hypothetical protein
MKICPERGVEGVMRAKGIGKSLAIQIEKFLKFE